MAKVISMRRDPGDQPQSRLPHAKSQGGRPGLPIGPVVEEYCEHLFATRQNIRKSGPISRHAVSNYVLVIKVFLHATRRDSIIYGEYLSTDTISAIALPKYDQVLIQPFTDADIKELLKAALAE